MSCTNKIFIVTGELSGDRVAAWYIAKQYTNFSQNGARPEEAIGRLEGCAYSKIPVYIEAVGGDFLAARHWRKSMNFSCSSRTKINRSRISANPA